MLSIPNTVTLPRLVAKFRRAKEFTVTS